MSIEGTLLILVVNNTWIYIAFARGVGMDKLDYLLTSHPHPPLNTFSPALQAYRCNEHRFNRNSGRRFDSSLSRFDLISIMYGKKTWVSLFRSSDTPIQLLRYLKYKCSLSVLCDTVVLPAIGVCSDQSPSNRRSSSETSE